LADRSVAVLNRGTPGGVVTPDGTLHMSLMRSCSAWPSGIWIDGDRRTAPDGSSFAWQHWSHTFEYALASGPGDWRAAGFSPAAEDYNHDLLTVTGAGPGADGAARLSVEPATVTLGALKPRGNPLAAGRVDAPTGGETVTVRLRETSGRPVTARVRFPGVVAAWLTDLLEEADGAPLPAENDTVLVDLPAFGTTTAVLRAGSHGPAGLTGTDPVQPVYARYWLHGKGPAPAGNLPVAVHFSPVRVALPIPGPIPGADPGEVAALTLTVGCGAEPASGTVELAAPAGVTVSPGRDLRYDLAPGGFAAWDLSVRVPPGTAAGRYFVAARIRDGLGQLIEDAAMVAVGERHWPDPGLPPEEALELMQADYAAGVAEADVAVLTPDLRLTPGSRGELQVRVTSGLASELRGEAQLVSPFGSWDMLGPRTQGFSVAPGASTVLRFAVDVPVTARPARWWALVKVMYYGRVRYTEAINVDIEPAN
ncbi:MAG TPA: NEW3 domain-containing protein, partial [Streptosporangiaceae bacterium]|nr:NEW3 domain-containing protein [Streptosporangiaceae bacterium]